MILFYYSDDTYYIPTSRYLPNIYDLIHKILITWEASTEKTTNSQ